MSDNINPQLPEMEMFVCKQGHTLLRAVCHRRMVFGIIILVSIVTVLIVTTFYAPITLTISMDRRDYKATDDFHIDYVVRDNLPIRVEWCGASADVEGCGPYRLEVKKLNGEPVKYTEGVQHRIDVFTGKSMDVLVGSESSILFIGSQDFTEMLRGYFDLTEPGTYTVQMIAEPVRTDFGTLGFRYVKSNMITFEIVP